LGGFARLLGHFGATLLDEAGQGGTDSDCISTSHGCIKRIERRLKPGEIAAIVGHLSGAASGFDAILTKLALASVHGLRRSNLGTQKNKSGNGCESHGLNLRGLGRPLGVV
jgi:hypothetical protein